MKQYVRGYMNMQEKRRKKMNEELPDIDDICWYYGQYSDNLTDKMKKILKEKYRKECHG